MATFIHYLGQPKEPRIDVDEILHAVEGQELNLTNNSYYLGHKDLGLSQAEKIDYSWDAHAHTA